jgi:uncharacterized protein (TIGR00369 family)
MAEKHYFMQSMFGDNPPMFASRLDDIPHCRELSMASVHAGPCEATVRIPFDPKLVGDPTHGVVFGGVITTLLDQAGGAAVTCSLEERRSIATIDLRIDYMRPATPGRDLVGYARCYRVTTNVAFVRGAAYHDDRDDPFAMFVSTYMLGADVLPAVALETLQQRESESGS